MKHREGDHREDASSISFAQILPADACSDLHLVPSGQFHYPGMFLALIWCSRPPYALHEDQHTSASPQASVVSESVAVAFPPLAASVQYPLVGFAPPPHPVSVF